MNHQILEREIGYDRLLADGSTCGEQVNVRRFNEYYRMHLITDNLDKILNKLSDMNYCAVTMPLFEMLHYYRYFMAKFMKQVALLHDVRVYNMSANAIKESLLAHSCGPGCPRRTIYVFRLSAVPRKMVEEKFVMHTVPMTVQRDTMASQTTMSLSLDRGLDVLMSDADSHDSHLTPASIELKEDIIREWQCHFSESRLQTGTCSVCAIKTSRMDMSLVDPLELDLRVLRNDDLPAEAQPSTYNFEVYSRAILHPRGLVNTQCLDRMWACKLCLDDLKDGLMPRLSLANWLYYGRDSLPAVVKEALRDISVFEKAMIARARTNSICCRFTNPGSEMALGDEGSRNNAVVNTKRGMKGNIVFAPLDVVRLNEHLPPSVDMIRDTLCVLFVGKGGQPTRANIEKFHPVLVRKSRVKLLIEFLLQNNPYYKEVQGFRGFSADRLNGLFESSLDIGLPAAVDVAWVEDNDAVEGAVSSYVPEGRPVARGEHPDHQDDLLIENVGYTLSDHTPLAYRNMKLSAVQRCLAGKPFIRIRKGDNLIPDFNNPYLLSWVLPHLDPWGIGGFFHPKRKRYISMEEQLGHMLKVDDDGFERDGEFAFLFFNVLRKKGVMHGIRFSAPARRYRRVVSDLLSVDKVRLVTLSEKLRSNPSYRSIDESELRILEVLKSINLLARDIPGGVAQKLKMRNEIRGLMVNLGSPALFITLNPSDKDNPLVQFYARSEGAVEDVLRGIALSDWERRLLAAKKPAACALFFDSVIKAFIKIVLRYGQEGAGLYGRCVGYYGTVEAQGRGTLHCHMLVWLEGHLSPGNLRRWLDVSDVNKAKLTTWLESIMEGDFLGDDNRRHVDQAWDKRLERELTGGGSVHPGSIQGPLLEGMPREEFWQEFRRYTNQLLVEYNIHEHTSTCWKYLARGQSKTPQNCRVGITGETQNETTYQPSSMRIAVKKTHPKMTHFTPLVTFLLKCNTDVKFVGAGSDANAFMYYVTDYITKAQMSLFVGIAALSYAIKRIHANSTRGSIDVDTDEGVIRAFTIAVNSMVGHQEISHQQVMSYLVGGGDHYTHGSFHTFNWGEVVRYAQSFWFQPGELQEGQCEGNVTIALGEGEISVSCQRLDYMFRPDHEDFVKLCLYDFLTFARKKRLSGSSRTQKRSGEEFRFTSQDHPQSSTHAMTWRKSSVIPVLLGPGIPRKYADSEVSEAWAMRIVILFKPWRHPEDLKDEGETWSSAYQRLVPMLQPRQLQIIDNIETLADSKADRDHHAESRRRTGTTIQHTTAASSATSGWMGDDDVGDEVFDTQLTEVETCIYGSLDQTHSTNIYSLESVVRLQQLLGESTAGDYDMCYQIDTPVAVSGPHHDPVGVLEVDEEGCVIIERQLKFLADAKYDHIEKASEVAPVSRNNIPSRQDWPDALPPSVGLAELTDVKDNTLPRILIEINDDNVDDSSPCWSIALRIAIEMGLNTNPEQLKAFLLIARHIVFGGDQLLMHVSGMGGTGKSYVVQAVVLLLDSLKRRNELLIGAPTGIAAVLIRGATLHSLVMANASKKKAVDERLIELWKGVRYLIIDEISMVGAAFFALMSSRIRIAKGDDPLNSTRLFGGVNVICLGDFCQLKPPKQLPLYSDSLVSRPSFEQIKNNQSLSAMTGAYLWRQFTTVVCLVKNQRQKEDGVFAAVLRNIRFKTWKALIDGRRWTDQMYIDFLRTRIISNVLKHDPGVLIQFADAPVIVGHKVLRDALNTKLIQYHSRRTNQALHVYYASDTLSSHQVSANLRGVLWALPSNKCGEMLGRLPLFIGMRVMITENLSINNGIVNGAEGTVEGIKYHTDESGFRYADAVYVKVPKSGIRVPGLEDDVVVLGPVASSIPFTFSAYVPNIEAKSFRRRQIPLVPAYSYTDYKSQGRSLDRCIIDVVTARGQGVYVMLSRVKKLDGLLILRWFSSSQIFQRFPEELRNELERIDRLDKETESVFNRDFSITGDADQV